MKKRSIIIVVLAVIFCGCATTQKIHSLPDEMQPEQIQSVMAHVADWQLANPREVNPQPSRSRGRDTRDWTYGALYAGLIAWAQMADTDTYYDALMGFGEKNQWQSYRRLYHADDYAVGQMYIDMYKKYQDPEMILPTQKNLDAILENPPKSDMKMVREGNQDRWNWCDALFMGPPVWTKMARITGEQKYLDFMNAEWWVTTDYLYDKDEHLYYRDSRYFDQREANGEKIFWSRGNGWVFGGLVRVLEELPEDHPDRDRYETLYKEMAARLVEIQPEKGLWHSSLLDPVSYPTPEASGSGFYCYGLAWGINHGLLNEKTYLPAVIKVWTGLVDCVHPDGMLGNVQPVGKDPRQITADQTDIYGVGSFLLAGSEVYKIGVRKSEKAQKIVITNPSLSFRSSETVSLDWKDVKKSNSGITAENVAILDFKSNRLLVTQLIDVDGKTELLFQTDFAPGEKKYFWVMKQPANLEKPKSEIVTYCRFVPEREDDFTWENDLIAFRMYGPGLWDDAVNSGVDCWLKRVPYSIIDKWYGQMNEKTYHKDWGEGYDPYHVGKTTGCGGLRIVEDDKLIHSNVYDTWKVIENGPIRSVFELTYDKSWKESGKNLIETKRVTIDLGQRLCRFDCAFSGPDAGSIKKLAVGVTTHDSMAQGFHDTDQGIAGCWETIDDSGLGAAAMVISPAVQDSKIISSKEKDESHVYLYVDTVSLPVITYYTGYGWEKAGDIVTMQSWQAYLNNFKECIDNPVSVQFAN